MMDDIASVTVDYGCGHADATTSRLDSDMSDVVEDGATQCCDDCTRTCNHRECQDHKLTILYDDVRTLLGAENMGYGG